MKFLSYACLLATVVGVVHSEVIAVNSCSDDEVKNCAVTAARISPCKEALKNPVNPCKFKKQRTASIEVDFTPEFEATSLHAQMYWPNGFMDLPLAGMENDACKTTTCPTAVGVPQTYKYDLEIATYFPLSTYDVKWILKGGDSDSQQCCFIFKIKITK